MREYSLTSGTAIGRLAAQALRGGASALAVKPLMAALTRDAVRLAKVERRKQRAWLRRQGDFLCGLEDGSINAECYSAAELYALTSAECQQDVPRLMAEWEAWERQDAALVTRWEEEQAGMALQADRALFAWDSAVAD